MLETSSMNLPPAGRNSLDHSVSELLDIVWRRKWFVAGCVAISVSLGALYLYQAEPVYSVRARVLVQPSGGPLDAGGKPRADKEFLATQAEIICSPAVIKQVLPVVTPQLGSDQLQDPLLTVLENLAVDPVNGTSVLSVSYRCGDPSEGIDTVAALLQSYQQFLLELQDDSRLESLNLLTRSEEKLRSELEDREAKYLELRKQGPFHGQEGDAGLFQKTALDHLATSLTDARERRIDLEQRVKMLVQSSEFATSTRHGTDHQAADVAELTSHWPAEAGVRTARGSLVRQASFLASVDAPHQYNVGAGTEPLADVELTKTPEYMQHTRELMIAELRESELAQVCGPKHPDLRAAREQVASLQERLRVINERAPLTLQQQLSVAQSREDELLELYQQELEKANINDDFLVRGSLALDGIERLKTIHNSIVAQLNDWHLVEPGDGDGVGTQVVILESPSIGLGPVWPKKSLLLSLCVSVGLVIGLGAVVVTKC